MKSFKELLLIISLVAFIRCDCNFSDCDMNDFDTLENGSQNERDAECHLSTQINALLDHFKQNDPVGIPGSIVPDPVLVPDTEHAVGMGHTLTMKNALAYGISRFRIKTLAIDITRLKVKAEVQLDALQIIGNYTLSSLFSSTHGPFNITVTNIKANGNASIAIERDGKIRTQEISMDMSFKDLSTDFKNLGLMGSIFQSFINNAPNMVFDTMKPFMLQEAYSKLRTEIDTNIDQLMGDRTLPNSISPLDIAIGEGRRRVREMGFDPLLIPNYNYTFGLLSIQLKNTWIQGVSGFYRIDDVFLSLSNHTITAGLHLGTQEIKGFTIWEVTAGKGILTRTGHMNFVVDFIRASGKMTQTLDTRNHPQMQDLQLEVGNVQLRSDGAGTLDYIIEFAINVIPNVLRYQIMDALEYPARAQIQNQFNKINVERFIKSKIPDFEQMCQNAAFNSK